MSTPDLVNHPPHYTAHPSGVECIQITEGFSFNIGNIIKYLWRADEKGAPIDDLRKAEWYLQREITRRIDEANTAPLVAKSASSPTEKIGNALAYAQAGDANRQYEMGNMAYTGEGMPQDKEQAVEWWTLAAAQGHSGAQIALDIHEVPAPVSRQPDEPGANLADIRLQAVGGDRQAQLYLAQGYAHGWYGLIRSSYMSCLWRSRANEPRSEEADVATVIADPLADMRARAEAGDRHAQCTLGDAYAHGMEVAKDRVESDRWYAMFSAPFPLTTPEPELNPATEESSATDHFRDATKMVSGESSAPTPTQPNP